MLPPGASPGDPSPVPLPVPAGELCPRSPPQCLPCQGRPSSCQTLHLTHCASNELPLARSPASHENILKGISESQHLKVSFDARDGAAILSSIIIPSRPKLLPLCQSLYIFINEEGNQQAMLLLRLQSLLQQQCVKAPVYLVNQNSVQRKNISTCAIVRASLLRALKSVREPDAVQFGANQLRNSAPNTQGFPHLWKRKVLGLP